MHARRLGSRRRAVVRRDEARACSRELAQSLIDPSHRDGSAHVLLMRVPAIVLAFVVSLSPSLAMAHFHRGGPHEAPPPDRVEVVRPRSGYIWAGGHYGARHEHYYWSRGHYERERPGREWRGGRWDRHEDHYDYSRGGWRR